MRKGAFSEDNYESARKTEPLEQVIDQLKEMLRTRHFQRLQKGNCSIEAGYVWSDLLTNLERVSDHCSNSSGCVLDVIGHTMNIHENQRVFRGSGEEFEKDFREFEAKFALEGVS